MGNVLFELEGKSLIRDVFVETGTERGMSLDRAVKAGFREIHSIEQCERHYKNALNVFRGFSRVHLHLGSSPDVLAKILDPSWDVLFWLDAHYQGGGKDELDAGGWECPLLNELRVIAAVPWKTLPTILIDDAKMFFPWEGRIHGFNREHWPGMDSIEALLPHHVYTLHQDILFFIPKGGSLEDPEC